MTLRCLRYGVRIATGSSDLGMTENMSGHSKWHKIQHKKGAADARRGGLFTKLLRGVTVAAQQGGGDPETNFALRLAMEKARFGNVPKDNVERAIKRGTGELKDEAAIAEAMYEGYGPGGIAVLIDAATDNPTRTVADIKHVFSKHGGSLGAQGSVKWQFARLGIIRVDNNQQSAIGNRKSEFELALIDAGADDIIESEFGIEIRCSVEKFQKVLEAVRSFGVEPADSGLEWVAKEEMTADDETSKQMEELYDALDELDDVREIYTNEK